MNIVIRVLAEHLSDPASIVRRVETALRAHGGSADEAPLVVELHLS